MMLLPVFDTVNISQVAEQYRTQRVIEEAISDQILHSFFEP